jgi:hypothetical protein
MALEQEQRALRILEGIEEEIMRSLRDRRGLLVAA